MNKYHAKKTNGYDSKKEASYADKLRSLMNAANPADRVIKVEEQVKYELTPAFRGSDGRVEERASSYVLDFRVMYADGSVRYIDVKGYKGGAAYAMFKLKKKIMRHRYGIVIEEV